MWIDPYVSYSQWHVIVSLAVFTLLVMHKTAFLPICGILDAMKYGKNSLPFSRPRYTSEFTPSTSNSSAHPQMLVTHCSIPSASHMAAVQCWTLLPVLI